MAIPLDQIANMPAFSPYYPMPPARYRNVRFQFVYFRADPQAVDGLLPACLTPADDGFCVAIGLEAPWTANYGRFCESLISLKCTFAGQVGFFAPVVFLNSRSSIPAGREIYGTPKVYAEVEVGMDERVMYTRTQLAGGAILNIRSTMQRQAQVEEMPLLAPSWRLKVIPRADGPRPEIMQLVDAAGATSQVQVHVCRAGEGVVQCDPQPVYDLSGLVPREYLGAHYVEMDYTEGYGTIVRDFLKEQG